MKGCTCTPCRQMEKEKELRKRGLSESRDALCSVPRSLLVDIDGLLGSLVHRHGSTMAEIGEADECSRLLAKVKTYSR